MKRNIKAVMGSTLLLGSFIVLGCASAPVENPTPETLKFNTAAWHYDSEHDAYWQLGVSYVSDPAAPQQETLAVIVPGAYLDAQENGDGTWTASINKKGSVNGFTAATAPIVIPVNTPGYSAQNPLSEYSYTAAQSYLEAGMIYLHIGVRGRANSYDDAGNLVWEGGAPWAVTDFKAGMRYYRYNTDVLPGNSAAMFTFGHSGGGAQSSLLGSTGDSPLYIPYLQSIGAAMTDKKGKSLSDATMGTMAWCPITSLDMANEAYEWNMGQFSDSGSRSSSSWTSVLSTDLADRFALYINGLGIKDADGQVLTLERSASGSYLAGSYYEYVVSEVERSLNNFLADTSFPYTKSANGGFMAGMEGPGMGAGSPPNGTPPNGMRAGGLPNGTPPNGMRAGGSQESVTYNTVEDYIAAINGGDAWVNYDKATNTARIASLEAFVSHLKSASKSVPAFDNLNRTQAENAVFGNAASDSLHFDPIVAELLVKNAEVYGTYADWNPLLAADFEKDLSLTDSLGNGYAFRQNMYNPMYFVSSAYEGYGSSHVSPYWRIRTGIEQGDTATTVEMNLALALRSVKSVKAVDFETVWAQGHNMAERTGSGTENFIAWVVSCTR